MKTKLIVDEIHELDKAAMSARRLFYRTASQRIAELVKQMYDCGSNFVKKHNGPRYTFDNARAEGSDRYAVYLTPDYSNNGETDYYIDHLDVYFYKDLRSVWDVTCGSQTFNLSKLQPFCVINLVRMIEQLAKLAKEQRKRRARSATKKSKCHALRSKRTK